MSEDEDVDDDIESFNEDNDEDDDIEIIADEPIKRKEIQPLQPTVNPTEEEINEINQANEKRAKRNGFTQLLPNKNEDPKEKNKKKTTQEMNNIDHQPKEMNNIDHNEQQQGGTEEQSSTKKRPLDIMTNDNVNHQPPSKKLKLSNKSFNEETKTDNKKNNNKKNNNKKNDNKKKNRKRRKRKRKETINKQNKEPSIVWRSDPWIIHNKKKLIEVNDSMDVKQILEIIEKPNDVSMKNVIQYYNDWLKEEHKKGKEKKLALINFNNMTPFQLIEQGVFGNICPGCNDDGTHVGCSKCNRWYCPKCVTEISEHWKCNFCSKKRH